MKCDSYKTLRTSALANRTSQLASNQSRLESSGSTFPAFSYWRLQPVLRTSMATAVANVNFEKYDVETILAAI